MKKFHGEIVTLEDFFKARKVKPAMAEKIRQQLAVGEEPRDYAIFYNGRNYFLYTLGFIVCMNWGYWLFGGTLGLPDALAFTVTFLISILFIYTPNLNHVGILLTNERLLVVSNLFKDRIESIPLSLISDFKLDNGTLRMKVNGKKKQFAMLAYSRLYWNDKLRKDFLRQYNRVGA